MKVPVEKMTMNTAVDWRNVDSLRSLWYVRQGGGLALPAARKTSVYRDTWVTQLVHCSCKSVTKVSYHQHLIWLEITIITLLMMMMIDVQMNSSHRSQALEYSSHWSTLMTVMPRKYLGVLFQVVYNFHTDCTFHTDIKIKINLPLINRQVYIAE